MDETYDVIVVGGGLCGLTAALRCQQAGLSVVVLEGRDRLGGRSYTKTETWQGKPTWFDFGAHFIGHDDPSPQIETRYHAVIAAHITHMLRDTCDDLSAGYFNIPREALDAGGITPFDVHSDAYRAWVQSRVQLAREMFRAGRDYLAQVPNARCRMAGEAYCAQFEAELDLLERHAYVVRSDERQERI